MSAITEAYAALDLAMKDFAPIRKDGENDHFKSKFAGLGSVLNAITPALRENGFTLMQPTQVDDQGRLILLTQLMHKGGHTITSQYPIVPAKNDPQGVGSALTYARRYALLALLTLVPSEDDDGNAASTSDSALRTRIEDLEGQMKLQGETIERAWVEAVAKADTVETAKAFGRAAYFTSFLTPPVKAAVDARIAELEAPAAPESDAVNPS